MADDQLPLTIEELSQRSRRSVSTLNRLKKAGLIPYFQPGGKGTLVTFPPDAIERACEATAGGLSVQVPDDTSHPKLSGPQPKWLKPLTNQKS